VSYVSLKDYIRKVIGQADRKAVLLELSDMAKAFGKANVKRILEELKAEKLEIDRKKQAASDKE
jgi:hypothetical protein